MLYKGRGPIVASLVTYESLFLTIVPLGIWVGILIFRGGFWLADQRLENVPEVRIGGDWPEVVCIIPARNEAPTIGNTLASLTDQDYPGKIHIIVVDDNSVDGTADVAGRIKNNPGLLHVVAGKPLEKGWSGKLWAVHQGLEKARIVAPSAPYVLLTDADITHDNESLLRLVAKAKVDRLDLVSLMARLRAESFWEKLLIPAFVFFFQKLYPFPWVNDPQKSTAAAAGGCMLVRRTALDRIGGVEVIRQHLIDDCKLASLLKIEGPIWLGLSNQVVSERCYNHLSEIWNMVARTAYEQLGNSFLTLIGTVVAMTIIYLVPPLTAAGILGDGPVEVAVGWLIWCVFMGIAFQPTLTFYRLSWAWCLLLPVSAFLYTLMTISSAVYYLLGRGGSWKGRHYKT